MPESHLDQLKALFASAELPLTHDPNQARLESPAGSSIAYLESRNGYYVVFDFDPTGKLLGVEVCGR